MVSLKLLKDGVSLEGHSQNSKACKSLTVVFHLFIYLFESDIILDSIIEKNFFQIHTTDNRLIEIMHKYFKSLSFIWGANEVILVDKT
jgi:hypothetical protein